MKKHRKKILWMLIVPVMVLLCVSGPAVANNWEVYKYSQPEDQLVAVPDVNKPGNRGQDNSCWQATAANMLGAAGYGTDPNLPDDPQGRADNIYSQFNTDLGWLQLGYCDRAINYWLYTYGKNSDSSEFDPTNEYTDVTIIPIPTNDANAARGMYDQLLLNELGRCQYVGVTFGSPEHCMTLVGGDSEQNNAPPTQSVWHDSDYIVGGAATDDTYDNAFALNRWDIINGPTGLTRLQAHTAITLCKGLNKPEEAMRNYDAAWFYQDTDEDGLLDDRAFRTAGAKAGLFGAPGWAVVDPGTDDPVEIRIENESIEDFYKEVWLLVDYKDRIAGRQENVLLRDDAGTEHVATTVTASADDGQLLFYWKLDYQPGWEDIVFPDDAYYYLNDYVKDWDVALQCVPEPATLALLLVGGLMILGRKRR